MKALLKFDFRKLLRSKSFYVCIGISLVMLIINLVTAKLMEKILIESAKEVGIPYTSPYGALTALKASFSQNTAIIQCVIVTIIVCEDFVGDTIKNIYSKGYTRTQVYFSKLITSLTAFLIIYLAGMIIGFVFGLALYGKVGEAGNLFFPSMLGIFFIALAYFVMYFSLAISFKKIAPPLIISIIGPTALVLVFALFDVFANIETFALSEYTLTGLISMLSRTDIENKYLIGAFIESSIFITVFGGISVLTNINKDVK